MKKFKIKSWMRYLLVFILLFAVNAIIRRCAPPGDELKDGNLLVNTVIVAIPTAVFIIFDRYFQKKRKERQMKNGFIPKI